MKNFEIVFLDMDGVLCDFMGAAHRAHGRQYDEATYPPGVWEIADHWQISTDEFWAAIHADVDFWHSIDPYPWLNELLDLAASAGDEVKILTSPAKSASCYSGKRMWWEKYIPRNVELILCKSKQLLASPTRLLIDDGDHNVWPWREAGGKAILFPQPWNANTTLAGPKLNWVRRDLALFTEGNTQL